MESTIEYNTTNKTLMDYAKSNIDVHINWLLFLNSFNSISNKKGFMEVAPILEEIRREAYTFFDKSVILNHTDFVNSQITKLISELLDKHELTDAKEHIGKNLSDDDIINLSTSLFIRKRLDNIQTTNISNKFILSSIQSMKNCIINTNITANGYSSDLLGYFLESLRISYNEDTTLQNYIYQELELAKGIELMAGRLKGVRDKVISTSEELLINQLIDCNHIESIYDVDNIFYQINIILDKLPELNEEEIVILKKQV